jgi:hypothetical protein
MECSWETIDIPYGLRNDSKINIYPKRNYGHKSKLKSLTDIDMKQLAFINVLKINHRQNERIHGKLSFKTGVGIQKQAYIIVKRSPSIANNIEIEHKMFQPLPNGPAEQKLIWLADNFLFKPEMMRGIKLPIVSRAHEDEIKNILATIEYRYIDRIVKQEYINDEVGTPLQWIDYDDFLWVYMYFRKFVIYGVAHTAKRFVIEANQLLSEKNWNKVDLFNKLKEIIGMPMIKAISEQAYISEF